MVCELKIGGLSATKTFCKEGKTLKYFLHFKNRTFHK